MNLGWRSYVLSLPKPFYTTWLIPRGLRYGVDSEAGDLSHARMVAEGISDWEEAYGAVGELLEICDVR